MTTSISDNFVKLSKSDEFNEKIREKTFDTLSPDFQKRIENTTFRIILLKNLQGNDNIKYDMFRRLNTGANKLNDMELRKCIYRSEFFSKLEELSKNEKFQHLIGVYNSKKNTKCRKKSITLRWF